MTSPISDILTDLYTSTHGGKIPIAKKGSDDEPDVLDFRQAGQAILNLVEVAMGEDAKPALDIGNVKAFTDKDKWQNQLRAEIRQKLGIPKGPDVH